MPCGICTATAAAAANTAVSKPTHISTPYPKITRGLFTRSSSSTQAHSDSSSTHPAKVARWAHLRGLHVPGRRRCWRQHRLLLLLHAVIRLPLWDVLRLLLRACRKQGVGPALRRLVGPALRGQQPLCRGAVTLTCAAHNTTASTAHNPVANSHLDACGAGTIRLLHCL
jgi:hypothetical protein